MLIGKKYKRHQKKILKTSLRKKAMSLIFNISCQLKKLIKCSQQQAETAIERVND
jgi:hypothetical protein